MKLTKGKIQKLLTKQKQTKRRVYKKSFTPNSKTFRRTRPTNLIRRTLKRIPYMRGGDDTQLNNQSATDNSVMSDPGTSELSSMERNTGFPGPSDQEISFNNDSDNATLANAFKILADYVASNVAERLMNGSISPLVNASQTQASNENRVAPNPSAPDKQDTFV